ncbi:MAG: ComEA family DNA-binding protein, partial [Myxococcota bacterium]
MIQNPMKRAGVAGALIALALGLASAAVQAAPPVEVYRSPVNLNTASVSELESLPGIGEVRARAIIAERKQRGGFRSLDQLGEVKGFGPRLIERLRPYLTLGEQRAAKRP